MTLAVATFDDSKQPMRLGIIASRKVGNAVTRNRARRRVREIARSHQHQMRQGVWVVIIISAKAARATYAELQDEYLRLAGRASILTP
jgi:ribonuclease P protein component